MITLARFIELFTLTTLFWRSRRQTLNVGLTLKHRCICTQVNLQSSESQ